MKHSLIEISEEENKLVTDAKNKYGKVYENAENLVFLLWDFLKSTEADAWIFVSFLSQVQKFAVLSLLSHRQPVSARIPQRHLHRPPRVME